MWRSSVPDGLFQGRGKGEMRGMPCDGVWQREVGGVQCAAFYCDPSRTHASSRLSALLIPPRHKRVGFDFVTDKNKQVTHDRKNAEFLVPALGFDWRCLRSDSSGNA